MNILFGEIVSNNNLQLIITHIKFGQEAEETT